MLGRGSLGSICVFINILADDPTQKSSFMALPSEGCQSSPQSFSLVLKCVAFKGDQKSSQKWHPAEAYLCRCPEFCHSRLWEHDFSFMPDCSHARPQSCPDLQRWLTQTLEPRHISSIAFSGPLSVAVGFGQRSTLSLNTFLLIKGQKPVPGAWYFPVECCQNNFCPALVW